MAMAATMTFATITGGAAMKTPVSDPQRSGQGLKAAQPNRILANIGCGKRGRGHPSDPLRHQRSLGSWSLRGGGIFPDPEKVSPDFLPLVDL